MRRLCFTKMVAAGNDFIVVDNRPAFLKNGLSPLARRLSDRKKSVGADGLILVEKSKTADVRMRIFNSDGSEAEMCGNGVRCAARFVQEKRPAKKHFSIETLAGVIRAEVKGDNVKAKMVEPRDLRLDFPLSVDGKKESWNFINTGVPHAVRILNSIERCPVEEVGERVRFHPYFAPRGANVDFVSAAKGSIAIRTYERGVEAETLSCGTGSVAGALVAAAREGLRSPVDVRTRSGEVLTVHFSREGHRFFDVFLEGRVRTSFEGRVTL